MPITVKTPKTPEGVNALFDQLATAQMEFNKVAAQVQKQTQKIAARYDPVSTALAEEIAAVAAAIRAYCDARKEELTAQAKTYSFTRGVVTWSLGQPAVKVDDDKAVLKRLEEAELKTFIRTTKALDKTAIKKDWDLVKHIKGLALVRYEGFSVAPHATAIGVEVGEKVEHPA